MQTQMTTSRTVTSGGGSLGGLMEGHSSYVAKAQPKTVIVQRSTGGGRSGRSSMYGGGGGGYSSGFSQRMSASFNPAIYSQMAGTGIAEFKDTREKEKREMQENNERLATYIEKVRWLEAKNKQLEAENEALRQRKTEDWRPIKDMYESELNQAREIIKTMSTDKGITETKMAGLQDEIEALKEMIAVYDNNAKDYVNKIDRLNSQVGEYEGELTSLRLRCGSLEDEIAKLRALIAKYKEENVRLRADLDAETAAHIQQEVLAQTLQEEVDFLNELLEKLQVTAQEPVQVKGMDMEQFFKGELRNAIAELNRGYEEKLEQMTIECESKVQTQMAQMKSGNVRDTMEAEHSKTEVKRLRDQLAEKNARIAQLELELAQIRADRDTKTMELEELRMEFHKLQVDSDRKLADMSAQIEALMMQLQQLMDAKMSLELEIACYRKLLEGEENRSGLRQLVEQTIGVRGGGASQMADIIGGGSSMTMTKSMRMQKQRTGFLGFKNCDAAGNSMEVELDSAARNGVDLRGYKIVKKMPGKGDRVLVDFSKWEGGVLSPGRFVTVFATGRKSVASDPKSEFIAQCHNFELETADYVLMDASGTAVSTLKIQF